MCSDILEAYVKVCVCARMLGACMYVCVCVCVSVPYYVCMHACMCVCECTISKCSLQELTKEKFNTFIALYTARLPRALQISCYADLLEGLYTYTHTLSFGSHPPHVLYTQIS